MDQWSRAYASHGVLKPHHFIGSISEIMKKLPEGLQISRVGQKRQQYQYEGVLVIP